MPGRVSYGSTAHLSLLQMFHFFPYLLHIHSIFFLVLIGKRKKVQVDLFFFVGITGRHSEIKMFLQFPKTKRSSVSSQNQRLVNLVNVSYISAEEQVRCHRTFISSVLNFVPHYLPTVNGRQIFVAKRSI